MRFDILTIFPEFFDGPLACGIVRRAREAGLIEASVLDLREFTHNRHRTVDDRPFGGGEGMVLKPEPVFEAVEWLLGARRSFCPPGAAIVLLSASGKLMRQEAARRFSKLERIVLLCGRYEGVDERVAEHLATEELSIGDFVLSGGELPAAIVVDAVTRLVPGALGNEDSTVHESFSEAGGEQYAVVADRASAAIAGGGTLVADSNLQFSFSSAGILECPHYTRPQVFRGWEVPEILMSGNHNQIRRWRRRMALAKTLRNRPELLVGASLGEEDRRFLVELQCQTKG